MARFSGGSGSGSGTPGPRGPEGESAYEVAVANGFVGTEQEWLDSLGGGTADIADFIFTAEEGQSIISLPGDRQMRIQAGVDSDLYLTAGDDLYIETLGQGDDIFIRAADDIRFSSNNQNFETETVYSWTMDSEGKLQLPGDGYISNPVDSSGDPWSQYNDTMHLVPDGSIESDQYVILDPTAPNHIHIRAGGQIDQSSADLILGGEKNKVVVSDTSRNVSISTRPDMIINSYTNLNSNSDATFITSNTADIQIGYMVNIFGTDYVIDNVMPIEEGVVAVTASGAVFETNTSYTFTFNPDWTNSWQFTSDGTLYGPTEGLVKTSGLYGTIYGPLALVGPQGVLLDGDSGEFLNDASDPNNQIATVGYVDSAIPELPQSLGEQDSPSFNQVYVTNNNGTGQNVKIGDDAWIGDLNQANYIGIVGAQDPTIGGIILGNSGTETIAAVDGDVYINSAGAMTLNAAGGNMNFYMDGAAYIGNSETDNRIVTVGELNGAITDAEPDEVSFAVNGGTLGTQPTFTGAPLFSGTYVKHGPMVHFQIQVDMDNITSFGTGQYFVDLPFPAKYGYQVTEGCLHDASTGKQYAMGGHVYAGESRLALSFTDTNGQDAPFDFNSPVTLTTEDNFHIAGTYITV